MRTDDLIVELARSAGPVRPLAPPLVRMAQWTAGAALVGALAILAVHPRADLARAVQTPVFGSVAVATAVTALLAAAGSFTLSVPGAARPLQRVLPLVTSGVWALILVESLRAGGSVWLRVQALPIHLACVAEITVLGLISGRVLFRMLRRAAPLDRVWTAALATLAAVSWSALATQIICPIDDPAHQVVGHLVPVACLVIFGTLAGQRSLDWTTRA